MNRISQTDEIYPDRVARRLGRDQERDGGSIEFARARDLDLEMEFDSGVSSEGLMRRQRAYPSRSDSGVPGHRMETRDSRVLLRIETLSVHSKTESHVVLLEIGLQRRCVELDIAGEPPDECVGPEVFASRLEHAGSKAQLFYA